MPAKASRAAFGEALIELGAKDERIVTLDADLSKSTMTAGFARKFPGRAFNLGIAESNMVGIAAGLALSGRVPFACSFACFVVGRFETIRISIACIRALPNVPIIQPADEAETKQAVAYAAEHQGPLYLRLTRQNLEPVCPPDHRFQLGRWCLLRSGSDVTLISTGGTVFNALEAARRLGRVGIFADVINASSIKPLDEEMLGCSAAKTGHVVTVEDHSVAGGLGGAVAEWLSEVRPTPLKRIGTTTFGESGDPRGLYAKFGFDPEGIARTVAKFLSR